VPEAPFAEGGFPTPRASANSSAAPGGQGRPLPDHVPNHEARELDAVPAGHDLAAGAQLPQLQLRQRQSLRDIEGRPLLEMHPDDAAARGIADGAWCACSTTAAATTATPRSTAAPAPAWSTAWASGGASWAGGTNVNEVTSQALTDLGAGRRSTTAWCRREAAGG
jgi:hypothetical protein